MTKRMAAFRTHASNPRLTLENITANHKCSVQIRQTQAKIKHTLTERWYAWDEAWKVAENDPEVNLNSDLTTPAYRPRSFEVRNRCTIPIFLHADRGQDEEDNAQPQAAAAAGAA